MHPVSNGAYATSLAPPLSDHQTYSQKLGLDLDTCMYVFATARCMCAKDKCIEPSEAMAPSDAVPGRPRRFRCGMPCLLLCAALLGLFDALHLQGVAWYGARAAERQVARRFSQKRQPTRGELDADGKAEARRLTSSIKRMLSAEKLIEVLDGAVDGPIFNFFHVSAAYTQLASLKRKRGLHQKDWDSPVLLRLHAQVEDMILNDQLHARETANVLCSIAQLGDRFSVPTQLLAALCQSIPTKVKGMNEQNLSNSLWACAKLKEVASSLLDLLEAVPAIVSQIPDTAKDMIPQALSNCLWASAQLKDVAPDVLQAVPAIVAQIPDKAKAMKPQELSNCIWASAQLKDVAPDVLSAVPAIVAEIPTNAQDMKPQHLSNCLLACPQLKDEVPEVLEIVLAIVCEIPVKLEDMKPQEMSNSLEALVLLRDSVPQVAGFLAAGGSMDDILRSAAARLNTLLPRLKGNDLRMAVPVVVWACAKAGVYDGELLDSVARRLGTELSSLRSFNICALSWSYQVLDTKEKFKDFTDFRELLMSEAGRRGFSEADVESCQRGRFRWNHAF